VKGLPFLMKSGSLDRARLRRPVLSSVSRGRAHYIALVNPEVHVSGTSGSDTPSKADSSLEQSDRF
jgi:hypothetical protein